MVQDANIKRMNSEKFLSEAKNKVSMFLWWINIKLWCHIYYLPRPRPSVCPSVTFSFRTVTRKRIEVFSRNFACTCTMSWGCAV